MKDQQKKRPDLIQGIRNPGNVSRNRQDKGNLCKFRGLNADEPQIQPAGIPAFVHPAERSNEQNQRTEDNQGNGEMPQKIVINFRENEYEYKPNGNSAQLCQNVMLLHRTGGRRRADCQKPYTGKKKDDEQQSFIQIGKIIGNRLGKISDAPFQENPLLSFKVIIL